MLICCGVLIMCTVLMCLYSAYCAVCCGSVLIMHIVLCTVLMSCSVLIMCTKPEPIMLLILPIILSIHYCLFVTGPAKINHVSANYTELYFC